MLIMIFPPFHDYHLLSRLIMIFPPFHDYHHDLLPRHYIMIFSPLHNHHHDLLPRLIMIFSPLHNHQQRSSPQAFLLQSISNPTKLIPMGDPEDPTGILYTKKYQCFEMFWNVLKCFEMHWNALKWWSRNQPVPFLASQDALEVMRVTYWLSEWVSEWVSDMVTYWAVLDS